jgi:protease-4
MRFLIRDVFPITALLLMFCPGCGTPSFLVTPVSSSNKLDEEEVQPGKGWAPGKIAIIPLEGMLANVKSGGLLQPTENTVSKFVQEMEEAEKDDSVKAVVLRVNSPGGTVTSSDTMYTVLQRFKEKTHKPVVASTQEVAASGAFYVSCAADKIVAAPTSVVGSIGVIFETMQFKGTLDKLGVTTAAIKSGSLKDMGSPFRAMKDDERVVMKEMVEEYFHRFVHIVADHRPVTEKPVEDLTTYEKDGYAGLYSGRVFSGEQAVALGLVDQTGQLTDALDLARKLANAPDASAIMYRRPYGYGGSIYASSSTPEPQANVLKLDLPESRVFLPGGFYYLWEP